MNRNYYNCEMVKVDQREFDEIMSKRVTMLSSLEEYAMNQIRIQTFRIFGCHNACFCDGCLFRHLPPQRYFAGNATDGSTDEGNGESEFPVVHADPPGQKGSDEYVSFPGGPGALL